MESWPGGPPKRAVRYTKHASLIASDARKTRVPLKNERKSKKTYRVLDWYALVH